jgi:hypothetical protein
VTSTHTQAHDVAIVSTSVNARPEAYAEWAKQGDLIVAGDRNSPPELADYLRELGAVYFAPSVQHADYTRVSESIGWRCEQRRNLAVMYAYEYGYDYVMTVDDDNAPETDDHVELHVEALGVNNETIYTSETGWFNPGIFSTPIVTQRGLPYDADARWSDAVSTNARLRRLVPVVSQSVILGAPDCDAIERITQNPRVLACKHGGLVDPRVYAPFGSQATLWRGDWAPLIACLPDTDRSQDIFASFIFERIAREYDVAVRFGEPCVVQERNDHNPFTDLRKELFGIEYATKFTRTLDRTKLSASDPLWVSYHRLGEALATETDVDWPGLGNDTTNFMHEWSHQWATSAERRRANRGDDR